MSVEGQDKVKSLLSTTTEAAKVFVGNDVSKAYAKHRHSYTEELFKAIADYCRETNPDPELALDVGSGPGMSTIGLAKYFKKVVGIDISPTQIELAPKDIPNVQFKVGESDKLTFIESGTVDLFSCGLAFYLMPQKETFAEADRVLKPGGTIALFGYTVPICETPEINEVLKEWVEHTLPDWPAELMMLFNRFSDIEIPYPGWIRRDDLKLVKKTSLAGWNGIVKSAKPAQTVHSNRDYSFHDKYEKRLAEVVRRINGSDEFDLVYEFFLLMGHKPKN